jgi:hypothetical protein
LKETIIKSKLPGLEQYLSKWNITECYQIPHSQINATAPSLNNKIDRLKYEESNPFPITTSSSHIIKLITQFISLGEPLASLAEPFQLRE